MLTFLLKVAGLLGLGVLALDVQYRLRPGNKLEMSNGKWDLTLTEADHYQLVGELELENQTDTLEIMVPEVSAEVVLLSAGSLDDVSYKTKIIPCHHDAEARADNYWFGYIVKTGKKTACKVIVDIYGPNLQQLKTAWVKIYYVTYGPQGRIPKTRHVVLPVQFPDANILPTKKETAVADVFPIKTHLITAQDTPSSIVKRYVLPHSQPGDIVAIAETPVALMQGRFRHPSTVQPGWVAKRVCYFFKPTSSLATACGLQTLVDIVGPYRVLFAFLAGVVGKLIGKPGMFYEMAGEQARLIDDVTGTLPPFDQFIVLGPADPQAVVAQIRQETGLEAAIVDVNDLRAVKILASTPGVSEKLLEEALISNPAGNADEQTPVVLVRPAAHT